MHTGVVASPHKDRDMDGKILLKRVSKKRVCKKTTYCKHIVVNCFINKEMHAKWRDIHDFVADPDVAVDAVLDKIQADSEWEIDQPTRDHLVLRCFSHQRNGKKKWCTLDEDAEVLERSACLDKGSDKREKIQPKDIVLCFVRRNGEEHEADTTCDSEFMKAHMSSVGRAIRKACAKWVPRSHHGQCWRSWHKRLH